jgi:hypothetical protein
MLKKTQIIIISISTVVAIITGIILLVIFLPKTNSPFNVSPTVSPTVSTTVSPTVSPLPADLIVNFKPALSVKKSFNLINWKEDFRTETISDCEYTKSCAYYVPKNASYDPSKETLELKVTVEGEGKESVKSARIVSTKTYEKGVYVFKAKIPKCAHSFPAIWFTGAYSNSYGKNWPYMGEIDVMETSHENSGTTFTILGGGPIHKSTQPYQADGWRYCKL